MNGRAGIREELEPILAAIELISPAAFRFNGESITVNPESASQGSPLVRDLQNTLYARCYVRRFPDAGASDAASADPAFADALARANHTQPRWEDGWVVYGVAPNGQVSLQKGDRQRSAAPGEFIHIGVPGVAPQSGAVVSVFAHRDSKDAQPGFYYAYGATLSDIWDDFGILRFYFHAPPEAAAEVIDFLTQELNRYQTPFRLKALIAPEMYSRTDAIVLYLARRYYAITRRVIAEMPRGVADALRPATPLFTRPIRPGIGMADDPNTGESFGQHRCRLLAEGMVEAWLAGRQTTAARFESVQARFGRDGLDLSRPYLNAGSAELSEMECAAEVAFA